ncbi:MAG: SUMF1/EgtB/PvdO family nonheme iron enzyme [bacterium]|nr:SUMF1/EgtB/PvdO family nonheme iron enzyme [bacterium]
MREKINGKGSSWILGLMGMLIFIVCVLPLACGGGDDDPGLAPANSLCAHNAYEEFSTFYIYRYEASMPDADDESMGTNDSEACSKSGVMPWYGVSDPSLAKYACMSAGGRLCSKDEWWEACHGQMGATATVYPWGDVYVNDICNVYFNPDNLGHMIRPTHSFDSCRSPDGVFDVVGNLAEWIEDTTDPIHPVYMAVGGSVAEADSGDLRCDSYRTEDDLNALNAADPTGWNVVGFRCCFDKR